MAFGGEEILISAETGSDEARVAHGGASFCAGCDYLLGVYALSDADFSLSFSVVGAPNPNPNPNPNPDPNPQPGPSPNPSPNPSPALPNDGDDPSAGGLAWWAAGVHGAT